MNFFTVGHKLCFSSLCVLFLVLGVQFVEATLIPTGKDLQLHSRKECFNHELLYSIV